MSVVKRILKVIFGCPSLDIQDRSENKNLDDECWNEYFRGDDILAKKVRLNIEKDYKENQQSKCQIYYLEDYR